MFTSPDNHCISYISNDSLNINTLVGDGSEGNCDGVASKSRVYQPCGITVEHDNIIYFTDIRVSTVKMCTPLKLTSKFLENTGKVYEAFSIHSDEQSKITMHLPQALDTINNFC